MSKIRNLGYIVSVALRNLLGEGGAWARGIYKFVTERAGSLSIRDYCEVKKTKIRYQVVAEVGPSSTQAPRPGELRFITLEGPEELTLSALNLELRSYKIFIGSA